MARAAALELRITIYQYCKNQNKNQIHYSNDTVIPYTISLGLPHQGVNGLCHLEACILSCVYRRALQKTSKSRHKGCQPVTRPH